MTICNSLGDRLRVTVRRVPLNVRTEGFGHLIGTQRFEPSPKVVTQPGKIDIANHSGPLVRLVIIRKFADHVSVRTREYSECQFEVLDTLCVRRLRI